jgi:hypothetical protein
MKRIITPTLIAALIAASVPALAAESTAPASPAPVSIRTSVKEAVKADAAPAAAYGPRSMPRQPNDGTRNQMGGGGGSKTGMIIGLVSAAAGIAATVYMVKQMKKTTDAASKTN